MHEAPALTPPDVIIPYGIAGSISEKKFCEAQIQSLPAAITEQYHGEVARVSLTNLDIKPTPTQDLIHKRSTWPPQCVQ
jgi:hypothetical protein